MLERPPLIGVVVPVFGHTRLVAEALTSLADQEFDGQIVTVVVIDGDPHLETVQTVTAFASADQRPTHIIYRRNGRLPAARNTGIDFLLEICPELDAIYLLDADNRLARHSLSVFWQSLQTDEAASWAYPDIGFFGLTWSASNIDYRETAPDYEPLRHLFGNICEAGSLVRASVFREGVRFDESFTSGYEDWEFWLQCLSKGLHGARARNSGFQYRRRSDSMLADADRVSAEIQHRILAKHGALFARESIVDKYCHACAPYVLVHKKGAMTLLTAMGDEFRSGTVTLEGIIEKARERFHFAYLPRYAILPLAEDENVPRPTIERTMQLLVGEQRTIRTNGNLDEVGDGETAAYQLVPIASMFAGQHPIVGDLVALYTKLSRVNHPHRRPLDRRYAGPASYQLDAFVSTWIGGEVAVPEPAPPPTINSLHCLETSASHAVEDEPISRRALLIDPLLRWDSAPLSPAAGSKMLALDTPRCLPFNSLDVSSAHFLGATFLYYTSPVRFDEELGCARRALALIVEDSKVLFYAGELKVYARSVAFLAPPTLSDEQVLAIRSAEHALAGIVCSPRDAVRLRSDGIPSFKVVEPNQFTSFLQRLDS